MKSLKRLLVPWVGSLLSLCRALLARGDVARRRRSPALLGSARLARDENPLEAPPRTFPRKTRVVLAAMLLAPGRGRRRFDLC